MSTTNSEAIKEYTYKSPKYIGNSFEDWYRSHYGTEYATGMPFERSTGMSDADWDIGQTLYNSYSAGVKADNEYDTSKNTLEAAYGSAIKNAKEQHAAENTDLMRYYKDAQEGLERSKVGAMQQQDRTYELMKKYLPEQLKENGLAGSGFAESTMLGAYSTHANNLSAIENEHAQNASGLARQMASEKSELDTELSKTLRDYETEKNGKLSELELAYLGNKSDRELEAGKSVESILQGYKEAANESVTAGIDRILSDDLNYTEDGTMLNTEGRTSLIAYLNANKERIGDDAYKLIMSGLDTMHYSEGALRDESTETTFDGYTLSYPASKNKIKITIDGKTYKLNMGEQITDDDIAADLSALSNTNDADGNQERDVIVVGGDMYMFRSGVWYRLADQREAVADAVDAFLSAGNKKTTIKSAADKYVNSQK